MCRGGARLSERLARCDALLKRPAHGHTTPRFEKRRSHVADDRILRTLGLRSLTQEEVVPLFPNAGRATLPLAATFGAPLQRPLYNEGHFRLPDDSSALDFLRSSRRIRRPRHLREHSGPSHAIRHASRSDLRVAGEQPDRRIHPLRRLCVVDGRLPRRRIVPLQSDAVRRRAAERKERPRRPSAVGRRHRR